MFLFSSWALGRSVLDFLEAAPSFFKSIQASKWEQMRGCYTLLPRSVTDSDHVFRLAQRAWPRLNGLYTTHQPPTVDSGYTYETVSQAGVEIGSQRNNPARLAAFKKIHPSDKSKTAPSSFKTLL